MARRMPCSTSSSGVLNRFLEVIADHRLADDGAGWIGVSAFVKQAALRPRLQVLRRTRLCRRTSGYCPLWSWHPPLRIEERDDGAKAALLQSFADNGVRPVLRGRIKSNQFPEMGPALLGPAVNLKQQT